MQLISSSSQSSLMGNYSRLPSIAEANANGPTQPTKTTDTKEPGAKQADSPSPEDQHKIEALKARDREVRAHEQAHLSAAGSIAISGASFNYQTGPDNQRYAIGGEVQIDTSSVAGDPEATLRKAETIRRAALAPASPSPQDHSVAANAAKMINQARIDLLKQSQQAEDSGRYSSAKGSQLDIHA